MKLLAGLAAASALAIGSSCTQPPSALSDEQLEARLAEAERLKLEARQKYDQRRENALASEPQTVGQHVAWPALNRPVSLAMTGSRGEVQIFADQSHQDPGSGKWTFAGRVVAVADFEKSGWWKLTVTAGKASADEAAKTLVFQAGPVCEMPRHIQSATSADTTMSLELNEASLKVNGPSRTESKGD